jgi:hypothetical protein
VKKKPALHEYLLSIAVNYGQHQLMNESSVHCVETKPEDPGTLMGSFNWYSFREKEDRIVRRKLRELKPVPDAVVWRG